MSEVKAVVEVTWLLAAIPGSQMVDTHLHLRDGSRIPVTVLTSITDDAGGELWEADVEGFASEVSVY